MSFTLWPFFFERLPGLDFGVMANEKYNRYATGHFTSSLRLASVTEEARANQNGLGNSSSRPPVHLAAQGGGGLLDRCIARALEYFPPRALYRGARSRSNTQVDAVHDAAADRRSDAAAGRLSLPVRRPFAGRCFFNGIAGRARGRAYRRGDYHHSRAHLS